MRHWAAPILKSLAVLAVLVMVWQLIISIRHVASYLLPGPVQVVQAAGSRAGSLAESLGITTLEAGAGLAASILAGLGIALLFAQWRWLRQYLYPYTILLQTVPIVAIAPLIINWLGPGIVAVAFVSFIICLAPIIANVTQGLISVDENLLNLFTIHRATPSQILFRLRLPNALPNLFTGIRIAAGISVIGAITGELFAGSTQVGQGGLGYAILYANSQLETSYMFALVGASSLLGFTFFFLTVFFEWLMLHKWHDSKRPPRAE